MTLLLLTNLVVFSAQFIFYFILQRIAGPTYLSQIGAVAAVMGVTIAYFIFGETVPENFIIAVIFIGVGVVFSQRSNMQADG